MKTQLLFILDGWKRLQTEAQFSNNNLLKQGQTGFEKIFTYIFIF